jgi:hypothetical protein
VPFKTEDALITVPFSPDYMYLVKQEMETFFTLENKAAPPSPSSEG